MKVFLVDDSPEIRQRLSEMLDGLEGIEIIGQADKASTAINFIHAVKPDVVLLDIQLVGHETGIDVLEQVEREKPPPKVIMLTNYPYPQYRQRCLQAGADFFFDKSIEFEKVIPALRELATLEKDSSQQKIRFDGDSDESTTAFIYTTSIFRPLT